MRMIEIIALDNGGHRNQTFHGILPDGWAVIPADMETPNFPFGDVTAEEINGVMTVTSWTAGEIPVVEETAPEPTELERLRADVDFIAVMTGVEL
ncbi:MAG: hypothetical protein IJB67_01720 [Firmicutes bacterium]|nr:hypothetical protein [Bacillota bacterium]